MGMSHLNGNLLCAIDCETTGTEPGFHDIVQLAIIPLDSNYDPSPNILPLNLKIKPMYPERADPKAMEVTKLRLEDIMATGYDVSVARDLLEQFFQSLNIRPNKYGNPNRMMPIAHNYPFDKAFMLHFLGQESYDSMFHPQHRDTMVAGLFLNDCAAESMEKVPFPKVNLQYMGTTLKVPNEGAHDALQDAYKTSRVYKSIVQGWRTLLM